MDAALNVNTVSYAAPATNLAGTAPINRVVSKDDLQRTRSELPAPIPSSLGQQGQVTRSKLSESLLPNAISAPERVLKPFGVAMLPEGPTRIEKAQEDEDKNGAVTPTSESTQSRAVDKSERDPGLGDSKFSDAYSRDMQRKTDGTKPLEPAERLTSSSDTAEKDKEPLDA